MPLAFDDAALARVMIAVTAIAPAEREVWLLKFGERAEQPKTCTSGGRVLALRRSSAAGQPRGARLARSPAAP
jgi:hypothetical protein